MRPTDEQARVVELFGQGKRLAVEAFAGTGKTTTLQLAARSTPRVGSYVAFNKSIAMEAGSKMPHTVTSSTAHSLALRQVGATYRHRLNSRRISSPQLARMLGTEALQVRYDDKVKMLQPSYLASLVMRGLRNFCMSDRAAPTGADLPYVDGIDRRADDGSRTYENNALLRAELEPIIIDAWADLARPEGKLPHTHDHYFKLWQLGACGPPAIPGEFVLFDEAQDASPVMLSAVAQNAERGAQVVFVGDSQQQIYEWRGAVNALASVPSDAVAYLTQSFRFGPAIADVANVILERLHVDKPLTGLPSIASQVGPVEWPDAVLCRSNAAAVSTVLAFQRAGRRPHLVGGAADVVRFAHAVDELQATGDTNHPELACFSSWGEVLDYVDNDPQGDDLALMVKLVTEFGVQVVVDALDGMIAEGQADIIVSTAHKAKGREWPTVRLAGDFPEIGQPGREPAGELRLLYVAATRAQQTLDVRMCSPLAKMLGVASGPDPI